LAKYHYEDRADEPAEPDPDDAKGAQRVGGALGLAILSTLAADKTTTVLNGLPAAPSAAEQASALVHGFRIAFAVGAAFMGAGAILLALMLRPSDVQRSGVQQIDVEEPLEAAA
jgi:hypothetical protein